MTAYLHHVSLPSFHSRRSYRAEAADAAVDYARGLIARARADGRADLPAALAHHGLTVTVDGHALLATIDAPAGPHLPGQPFRGATMPLVTIAVPRKSRVAPALWTLICVQSGLSTPPERPPAPWAAVWLHPTLGVHTQAAGWLGDLERLIAWAWIERDQ